MRSVVAVIVAGLLLLTGCVLEPRQASPDEDPAASVPWDDYDPAVRERIDQLADNVDCVGLQGEFDAADANGAATQDRTGHNNADLMAYIDHLMRVAGCYG